MADDIRTEPDGYITGDLDGDEITGGFDEDGFHLIFRDFGIDARICDIETARKLVASVEPLTDWIAEHDRERNAYDRATPEERARVLHEEEDLAVGDRLLNMPVIATEVDDELLREQADIDRKERRENQ